MRVLPLYPFARALQALADAGLPHLRPDAIRAVHAQLRAGRDGLATTRDIHRAMRMRKLAEGVQ